MTVATPPTLVVVNPASAGGRTARRWPEIQTALQRAGVSVRAQLTLGRGDAIELTRRAISDRGIRRIVAVGGDGTLNEVVNGCYGEDGARLADELTVGLIASGTGSDFQRTLGVSSDPMAAARVLAAGTTRPMDVGRLTLSDGTHRHFINAASCGIGAEVVDRVDRRRRRGGGRLRRLSFLTAAVGALFTYRNRDVVLTIDTTVVRRRAQQVVVANGRAYGAGMLIAPEARVDDGLLDVVVVGDISRLAALRAIPRLYRGEHLTIPTVEGLRARRVRIATEPGEDPPLLEADGERAGRAPAEVTVLPSALRFAAPAGPS